MTTDLSGALHQAALAGTALHTPIPAAPVLSRIRRRRATRAAATGAAGLVTVGAVTLAGTQLAGPPGPAPTGSAQTMPAVVAPAEPLGGCGSTMPELDDPEGTRPARLVTELSSDTVSAGGYLEIEVGIDVGADGFLGYPRETLPVALLARDGVVVAMTSSGASESDHPAGGWSGAVLTYPPLTVELVSCETGEHLLPGDYELYVTQTFDAPMAFGAEDEHTVRLGDSWVPPRSDNPPVTLAGGPWEIRISAEDRAWADVDPADLPPDLPLPEGRVLLAEEAPDGRLRVVVDIDSGRDAAGLARAALEDAGYSLEHEETDPDRPFWHYAELSGPQGTVTLDVSNETGGGFYGDWVFTPH